MIALTLLAILCGAVLAFRYKALMLYPVILCAGFVALTVGFATRADRWSIVLSLVVITVALQSGYLFGIFVRGTIAASRAASIRRRATVTQGQHAA